jgi:hypothetical protein
MLISYWEKRERETISLDIGEYHLQNKTAVSLIISLSAPQDPREKILDKRPL